MNDTPRLITLVGSILVLGLAAATGCSADSTSDNGGGGGKASGSGGSGTSGSTGTAGTPGSGGSATSGGAAGTSSSGGSAGTSTAGTSSSGGAAGTSSSAGSAGTGTSGSGSGGGGACPGPGDFDDGDPCTFGGNCPSSCGIEELGSRSCACTASLAECDACMPPDATAYPITGAAAACPGDEDTIRDMACDTEGTPCTLTGTNRGCVCWVFESAGTTWTCGSINSWF